MASISEDIAERRERGVEALVRSYSQNLEDILARAQARVVLALQDAIDVENGVVRPTVRTQTALRGIDRLFMREMDRAGLPQLIDGFTGSFTSQIPVFQESLALIAERQKIPLEELRFTSADTRVLLANARSAQLLLRTAAESGAAAARQNAMLTVGGIKFPDLAEGMAKKFRLSASRSEAMAKTVISTYYRLMTARSADRIEQALPAHMQLMYQYLGPVDKLTRPFCRELMKTRRPYTRTEIEAMNNGQTSNPFLTCGGYKCRHVWGVDSIEPVKRA
jgi:hypothetical protein